LTFQKLYFKKMKRIVMCVLALAILNGCVVGTAMRGGKKVNVYRKDIKATPANHRPGNQPCSDEW
jgi:hypothetical protein